MADFYKRVNHRIESLASWEETIARIDELNDLILEALKERSRFPVCRDYFDISRRRQEANPQKELEAKGIDTIGWNLYSKIVEKICPEGDYVEGVVKAESELEELVHERIYIGHKVIEHKAPRGKDIERKDREEKIIAYVRDYASRNEMNPNAVEEIFRFLMEKNKYIQKLSNSRNGSSNNFEGIDSCITAVSREEHKKMQGNNGYIPEGIASIRARLMEKGKKLAEQTGETYHVVHVHQESKTSILPVYAVKLVQE